MWAIIGGSGFENFKGFETIEELDRDTAFGQAASGLKKVKIGDQTALFLSRHGSSHELLPSEVNYQANMFALKKHGATAVLAFSAVGSLKEELAPEDLVIPTQYIDRTKGIRKHSFCGDGVVGHVSLAKPVCEKAANKILDLAGRNNTWKVHTKKTYVCIEGPYFSTQAESFMYRQLGADIIGMTNFPEFALAREAGLNYMPCCFVTDYDCWNEEKPHVTLDAVIEVMRKNNSKAFHITREVLKSDPNATLIWAHGDDAKNQGLKTGLMTPKEFIPAKHNEWLEIVLS
jgi:5'-methylthioadenosine phosphorylase